MNNSDDLKQFAGSLESEHPQTAAVLLFSLPPEEAGIVLRELPVNLAIELSERIVNTGEISPESLQILYKGYSSLSFDAGRIGGEKTTLLLDCLPHSGYLRQREIILGLEDLFAISLDYDGIRIVEDLKKVNDHVLGEALAVTDHNDITLALRIAGEETRKMVLSTMESKRASEIRSDLDWGGGALMSDVEAASERLIIFIKNNI